jgi:hypothetical protein
MVSRQVPFQITYSANLGALPVLLPLDMIALSVQVGSSSETQYSTAATLGEFGFAFNTIISTDLHELSCVNASVSAV